MTTIAMPSRIIGPIFLIAFVAACGNRETPVRGVPQTVHPSPSALAQGTTYTPTNAHAATQTATYTPRTYSANDGSKPFID